MKQTANKITASILTVVNMTPGAVAYRINNVGIWDASKGVYRAGNTQKGLPDIIAILRGLCVFIEVKAGADRQSEHQKCVQQECERAKGVYILARSTDQFIEQWDALKIDKMR